MRLAHIRLLIGSENGSAGSSVYNRELATRLSTAGYRIEVICETPLRPKHNAYQVYALTNLKKIPLMWNFESLINTLHIERQIRDFDLEAPDIVIGLSQPLLKVHQKLFPDVPWIYFPHALDIATEFGPYKQLSLSGKIARWHKTRIQDWALKQSDRVMRFSSMGVQYICDTYKITDKQRSKFVVNYPGVTNDACHPGSTEKSGILRFLIVGSLIERKRVGDALLALERVKDSANWHLDIVGDGPEQSNLEALVRAKEMQSRVTFIGRVENISEVYAKSDVLLVPSRSEGFGLVVIEAMSNGLPVLAYSNRAPDTFVVSDELIQQGVNGYLARDIRHFSELVQRAVESPEQLREMSKSTREMAAQKYDWSAHIAIYERLFCELREEHASP